MVSILVVDDDKDIRFLYNHALVKHYTIYEASTGAEALEIFKSKMPDAVIMDTSLPDANGIEVSKQILEFAGDTILIGSTGYSDKDKEFFELGAKLVIHKPFSIADLLERVKSAIY